MTTVLFACVHNAGRSQMAAAIFNQVADPGKARAISAGTDPSPGVHPEVQVVMCEQGVDLTGVEPLRLTEALAHRAQWLITMGCGDRCPFVPGAHTEDWPLDDPKGRPLDEVRAIRDEIATRVAALVDAHGWR
jgi:arsenate reductase (thioredoxin)